MLEFIENLDINQYLPAAIALATNVLLAIVILLIGFWIAGRANRMVQNIGKKSDHLDDTLFRFLGGMVR